MFSRPISRLCFRNPESRAGHRFWFSVVSRRQREEKAYVQSLKNGMKHMPPTLRMPHSTLSILYELVGGAAKFFFTKYKRTRWWNFSYRKTVKFLSLVLFLSFWNINVHTGQHLNLRTFTLRFPQLSEVLHRSSRYQSNYGYLKVQWITLKIVIKYAIWKVARSTPDTCYSRFIREQHLSNSWCAFYENRHMTDASMKRPHRSNLSSNLRVVDHRQQ